MGLAHGCGMGLRLALAHPTSQRLSLRLLCSLHGMENLTRPIERIGTTQPVTPYRVTWHAVPCCVRRVIVLVKALLSLTRRIGSRSDAAAIAARHLRLSLLVATTAATAATVAAPLAPPGGDDGLVTRR